MKKERATFLIMGNLAGILNADEHQEFQGWLDSTPENKALYLELAEQPIDQPYFQYRNIKEEEGLEKFLQFIQKQKDRIFLLYLVSAACVVMAILGVIYLSKKPIVAESILTATIVDDLKIPDEPILALSDSSLVRLDQLSTTGISEQLGVRIRLEGNRHLVYENQPGGSRRHKYALYNTVSIPNGKPWRVTLPDGTSIWLNAGSALSFPITETGKDRIVQLRGEGYFEVATVEKELERKIFKVIMKGAEITATGTRFNVKGYEEDTSLVAILLEGHVTVLNKLQRAVLSPGLAAFIDQKSGQLQVKKVDTLNIASWTKGILSFNRSSITQAMLAIGRAYNVKVVFVRGAEKAQVSLQGNMSTEAPLQSMLKTLDHYMDGKVKLELRNGELYVIPIASK